MREVCEMHNCQNSGSCQPSLMETSLESRMLGNQPVRFGKGELETCQRLESGNGECRFNRSRQPFWRRGNAPASYFMKRSSSLGTNMVPLGLNGLGSPFGIESF